MAEELEIGPGTKLDVVSHSDELLGLRASYEGGGKPPPPHLHPAQDERFEILAGTMRAKVAGLEQTLSAGEVLEIPRRTVHQMWNEGEEQALVRLGDEARRAHARVVPRGRSGPARRAPRRPGDAARALQRHLSPGRRLSQSPISAR